MGLREVELHVRFAGGIETKSDQKAVPAAKLLRLENGIFSRAISIRKRNGYASLSQVIDGQPGLLDDAIRLAGRDGELLAFSPSRSYSRAGDQWSDVGAVYSPIGTDRPLVRTGTEQLQPDHASLDGIIVSAWEDSLGGVWWSVSTEAGRVVRAAEQADASGSSPRCVAVGPNLHIYYSVPAQQRVMVIVVNPATPATTVTPQILISDLSTTSPAYDACPTDRPDTPAAIAWHESGTANIRLGYVDKSGVLGSPLTGHPAIRTDPSSRFTGGSTPLAIAFFGVDGGDGDRLVIALVSSVMDIHIRSFTGGSLVSSISNTGLNNFYNSTDAQRIALTCVSASLCWIAVEEAAVAPSNRFVVTYSSPIPAVTSSTATTLRSVGLASRAFAIDGHAFATFVHDTSFFNTYLTMRISDAADDGFVCVGRHAPAGAAGAPIRKHLSSAHVDGAAVKIALPVRERLISETGSQFRETGLRLVSLDFDSEDSHQAVQLGRGLYMAGACPQHYDGLRWTEQGFHVGPELIVATPAAGGSMTASTTYQYRAWYEWPDTQGEVHLGPISISTSVTMAGGQTQVTLTLPTLRVTQKPNVRICVARSLAAATGSTAQLFRVTSLDPSTLGDPNGIVYNNTAVDTVTFIDQMSDATLRLQEELYTNGGTLSNDPSPVGSVIAVGKGRAFATDPSNGNAVRYSQPIRDGFGVEMPPDLVHDVDPFGGDVTAIAVQDDRIVLFKASAIFMFSGDGPPQNGDTSTSGFTIPQLITSDVGCTDPASVVLTPLGHMFKSAKGIYMLGRDGAVSYVGAPAEAFNGQLVRAATVMPDRTQVVFLTDDGTTLLYDFLFGQWSTFTNHEGQDAIVVGGVYHYLRNDGRVYQETIGQFSDAGVRIRLRFETAWLHLQDQLQGFTKFWGIDLLGTWVSPHQLGIAYQTEYVPQYSQTFWYDATGLTSSAGWITGDNANPIGDDPITGSDYGDGEYGSGEYGGVAPDTYNWHLDLNEKGASIQFRFEDFEAVGFNGGSFELTEMLIRGSIKSNSQRSFSDARRF